MKFFQVGPIIHGCDTFKDFVEEFEVDSNDLVLSNEYIYEPLLKDVDPGCHVIYQEDFGKGEPTDTMVAEIMKAVDKIDYNRLIAIGGGAVMDIGKILALKRTETIDDLYADPKNVVKEKTLIAVPTTAGTGSEITNVAVMNRTKMDLKMGIQTQDMFADYAVLIPQMLDTVPYKLYANTTVDALIHAIEAFISKNWTPFTEMFAIHAIKLILQGYINVRDNGPDARFETNAESMLASTYAGLAFCTSGCGTVHACSFAFGGKYHVPHGEACYQFFIETLRYFQKNDPEGRIKNLDALLCDLLDVESDGIGALETLLDQVAPLEKMSAYGASEKDIEVFAKMTYENQQRLLKNNAYPIYEDGLAEIFEARL
ncbi:MAG: iron-containing alcohol dehydrogenase [Fastidiosipilaceae bacterium]|jgi:4-hydroxybutyrate dehydrogenase|nr:4-hydroxybutyrate dehydrogenase [Clostridiaceae bacterium]